MFFVSVAAEGLSSAVSLLFATLAGRSISVAAKGLTRMNCRRESNWVGAEDCEGLKGLLAGRAWFAGHRESCRLNSTITAYRYSYVYDYLWG